MREEIIFVEYRYRF